MTNLEDVQPMTSDELRKTAMRKLGLEEDGVEHGIRQQLVRVNFSPDERTSLAIRALAGRSLNTQRTDWIDETTEFHAVRIFASRCCELSFAERQNRKRELSDELAELNSRTVHFPHLRTRLKEIQSALNADLSELPSDPKQPSPRTLAEWDVQLRMLGPQERAEQWRSRCQLARLDSVNWAKCARQLQFSAYTKEAREQSQFGTKFIDEIAQLDLSNRRYLAARKKRVNRLRRSVWGNRAVSTIPYLVPCFLFVLILIFISVLDHEEKKELAWQNPFPYSQVTSSKDSQPFDLDFAEELSNSLAIQFLLSKIPELEIQIENGTATEKDRFALVNTYLLASKQPQIARDGRQKSGAGNALPDQAEQEQVFQRKAFAVLKGLVSDYPENPGYVSQFATLSLVVGNATIEIDDARDVFQTGAAAARPLAESGHASSDLLSTLGALLNNLTLKLDNHEKAKEIREHLESAIRFQMEALKKDPLNETSLRYLHTHFHNLSHALLRSRLVEDAVLVLLEQRSYCFGAPMSYGENAFRLFTISERLAAADALLNENAGQNQHTSFSVEVRNESLRTLNMAIISGFADPEAIVNSVSLRPLHRHERFLELVEQVSPDHAKSLFEISVGNQGSPAASPLNERGDERFTDD